MSSKYRSDELNPGPEDTPLVDTLPGGLSRQAAFSDMRNETMSLAESGQEALRTTFVDPLVELPMNVASLQQIHSGLMIQLIQSKA